MSKKRTASNRTKSFGLVLLTVFVCAVLLSGGYFYYFISGLNKQSSQDPKDNVAPIEAKSDESVNILVVGVDVGTPGKESASSPKRTDTMMLVNYNPKTKGINVISIPRDTLITIDGKRHKINEAYAIGRIDYSILAVEKLLNTQVNYYCKVDYEGFRKIIDAIGGVDMEIKNNMNYDDASQNLHIHFTKGSIVHLDGRKAEEFFRWRKNNDGTGLAEGDIGRIENQHLFIEKVENKFKTPSIIIRIPSILGAVQNYIETNMSTEEIMKYGYIFSKASKENIKVSTLKGTSKYLSGISYFIYDEKQNEDLLSVIHMSNGGAAQGSFNKSNLRVEVLNATKETGLASKYSQYIKDKGYSNVTLGNGIKSANTKIIFYGVDKDEASKISRDFQISNVEFRSKTSGKFDITVVLGNDYKAIE